MKSDASQPMNEAGRASYREEASELLGGLETVLLELESAPGDMDLVHDAFRRIHTIKGSGAMFGFDRIAAFTHEVETAFDLVRGGRLEATRELVSLALEARDHIQALLEAEFGGAAVPEDAGAAVLAAFRTLTGTGGAAAAPAAASASPPPQTRRNFCIRFRPPRDAFLKGTNLVALLDGLRELGACGVVASLEGLPPFEDFDPEVCYLTWQISLSTVEDENAIHDVFLFVEDESELVIESSEEPAGGPLAVAPAESARPESGVPPEEPVAEGRQAHAPPESSASVRVTAEKLDSLVNVVGELVTVQARLKRLAGLGGGGELGFLAEELERLTNRLRADTMSVRMLPIGTTFARFRRLVRDLARELGKEIELTVEGAETELDKNVIEQLNDPLVHIIRNAIDHGLESPVERQSLGKPRHGTIHLAALHSGAHVLIRITDDGRGLDREAILAKARASGLVEAAAEPSDSEVFQLIFAPGFSTAREVTGISGRGVGLDVVQRAIQSMRGGIDIRSTPGAGATFTLKIPLTLAIIDGLLVSVAERFFVMPLSNIVECVELTAEDRRRLHGRHMVNVRDELVPFLGLREYFAIPGEAPRIEQVILAETEQGKFGIVVDRVVGDHQTMVKSLGRLYRDVEAVSGATILGDGAVAVILDLEKLVKGALAYAA